MLRTRSLVALTALAAALANGCAALAGDSNADSVARQLADGLSRHSLADVPLSSDQARQKYAQLVAPLGDQQVQVSVGDVTTRDRSAEATLIWTWDLAEDQWRYRTTAKLVDDGNRWEVEWTPAILEPSLEDGDRLGLFTDPGRRGRILGQDGVPLVVERPVLRYGIDMTQVPRGRSADSARQVAEGLGIDPEPYVARVTGAGRKAFVEALVLRAEDARELVDPGYALIPGAVALEDQLPLAPTPEFAAEIIGRVGEATAEIIEEGAGGVQLGDMVGVSGLQARYEEQLAAEEGLEVVAADRDGSRRTMFRAEPRPGQDLRTTLDLDLQMEAERVLATLGEDGPRSALVAMRPSDGSILAAANGPGNDGLNIATAGQSAPGSTFKVVTALALLRAGTSTGEVLPCPDTVEVDGRSFENYDDYPADSVGDISFRTAFANSCNTSLIGARDRLQPDDLAGAAAALGLGQDHDLGFPAYFGQVPPTAGETEEAANLIGQGKVLASPMAMAAVAASVGAGRAVIPTLLPDHDIDTAPDRTLTDEESATLSSLMRSVVTEGSAGFLADVPGDVAAKTGTAEYGEPAPDGTLSTHAWMIALQGDLAVAVFVETGQSGSATAGPLLEEFLR